jgi:hypothetical protein
MGWEVTNKANSVWVNVFGNFLVYFKSMRLQVQIDKNDRIGIFRSCNSHA